MNPCASMMNPLPEPWCGSSKSRGPSVVSSPLRRRRALVPAARRRVDVHDGGVDPLGDVGEVHGPDADGPGRLAAPGGSLHRGAPAAPATVGVAAAGENRPEQKRDRAGERNDEGQITSHAVPGCQ